MDSAELENKYGKRFMQKIHSVPKDFKVSEVQESKIDLKGIHFRCVENDNEIIYQKEDGDSGQFLFGHITGIGGYTVISKNDLLNFLSICSSSPDEEKQSGEKHASDCPYDPKNKGSWCNCGVLSGVLPRKTSY